MTPPRDGRSEPPVDEAGSRVLHLDLRGLHCPMPVLRARKALRALRVGDRLVLECTDPLSTLDIPHFASTAGHVVDCAPPRDDVFVFHITKGR